MQSLQRLRNRTFLNPCLLNWKSIFSMIGWVLIFMIIKKIHCNISQKQTELNRKGSPVWKNARLREEKLQRWLSSQENLLSLTIWRGIRTNFPSARCSVRDWVRQWPFLWSWETEFLAPFISPLKQNRTTYLNYRNFSQKYPNRSL